MPQVIDSFRGQYRFLSNFYNSPISLHGRHWSTVEHVFQAAKTLDKVERENIRNLSTPAQAKKKGKTLQIRPDWEDVKYEVMLRCIRLKFVQNQGLRNFLLDTGNALLIEGNTWHDNIWGDCRCPKCRYVEGKNYLGLILTQVRQEFGENDEKEL